MRSSSSRPNALLRPLVLVTVLGMVMLLMVPAQVGAQTAEPVSEGVATDTCRDIAPNPQQACDTVRSVAHATAEGCRRSGMPDPCTPLNGQRIADDEVAAHEGSAVAEALDLQRRLQEHLPMRHSTFVATHNSYNSRPYRLTPSRMDANQTYSLSQQLRMDVRRLELDVHTWTDVMTGQTAPILCHATNAGPIRHVGCTAEMTLTDGLVEIDGWLDDNPDELVMLRVETHLDGVVGYDQAAAAVEATIGDHLLRPLGEGCAAFDMDLTRAAFRDAGQVMLVSDCGPSGSQWGGMVFDDGGVRRESTARSQDFTYPNCAGIPQTGENSHETSWVRFYDDATLLSSLASFGGDAPRRVVPADVVEWTRCGVNQPAFDHLTPTDGRLAALVWTWADGEGVDGDCAVISTDTGRLSSVPCEGAPVRPFLCTTGYGEMVVTEFSGAVQAHDGACRAVGAVPAVPRSGYEAQRVVDLGLAGQVWIALARDGGRWAPTAAVPTIG